MAGSIFAGFEAIAQNAVEDFMGEEVIFRAFQTGNYTRAEDLARADQSAIVTHFLSSEDGSATGMTRGADSASRKIYLGASILISERQVKALVWMPRKGDRVVVHPGDEERWFQVDTVLPLDGGDFEIRMSEESIT